MTVVVLATMYTAAMYGGQPLYWSTPEAPLYHDASMPPWIALPESHYRDGIANPGDLHYLRFPGGSTLMARAYDAGPFASYCVRQPDGSCPGIGLDVPEHLWPVDGLSAWVELYNVSAAHRASWTDPDRLSPQRLGSAQGAGCE